MYSLKAINSALKTFAQSHAQVNSYGYGDLFNMSPEFLLYNEVGGTQTIQYPIIWVMPAASTIDRRLFRINYTIVFGDILLDDYSNVDNVLSDTAQTMGDMLAWLIQTLNKDPESLSIADDYSYRTTPFIDDANGMFPDKIAGWKLEIVINCINTNNTCQIPLK